MKNFSEEIYRIHDVECNQKYAGDLPYSFHLKAVRAQGEKFIGLIEGSVSIRDGDFICLKQDVVKMALDGHDLIEDGRQTYNDLIELGNKHTGYRIIGTMFADIVYAVTDEKGKTRKERKSDKYYQELSENKLAVFVKLSDIAANTLFSKLTGNSMYMMYKREFKHFKEKCYVEDYKEFFDYAEKL